MKRALSKLPFACGLEMKLHLSLSGSSKYKAALLYSHHSVVKSSKVFKKYSVDGSVAMWQSFQDVFMLTGIKEYIIMSSA